MTEPGRITIPGWPEPGGTVHRVTGRVLPVRPDGRALLLHGWAPERPEAPFWFTVGGAAEPGEPLARAAARELAEEAGIIVPVTELAGPLAESTIEFWWGGWKIVNGQTFYAVAVPDDVVVSMDGMEELERATTDRYGWFTAAELRADGTAGHPEIIGLIDTAVAALRGRERAGR